MISAGRRAGCEALPAGPQPAPLPGQLPLCRAGLFTHFTFAQTFPGSTCCLQLRFLRKKPPHRATQGSAQGHGIKRSHTEPALPAESVSPHDGVTPSPVQQAKCWLSIGTAPASFVDNSKLHPEPAQQGSQLWDETQGPGCEAFPTRL